jgi:hypothetical protein
VILRECEFSLLLKHVINFFELKYLIRYWSWIQLWGSFFWIKTKSSILKFFKETYITKERSTKKSLQGVMLKTTLEGGHMLALPLVARNPCLGRIWPKYVLNFIFWSFLSVLAPNAPIWSVSSFLHKIIELFGHYHDLKP